jgi:hypothetical protein
MPLFLSFIIFNNHSYNTIIHPFILRHLPRSVFLYEYLQRRTRSIEDRHPDFVVDAPSLASKQRHSLPSARIRERLARISGRSDEQEKSPPPPAPSTPQVFYAWHNGGGVRQDQGSVLRIRIRDPVLFWPLDPGSGMGRKSASGSGIRDEQPGSYFLELQKPFFWVKILKFFDADPGSGMETVRIRDPGWIIVGSGIRDKHPGSATLLRIAGLWIRSLFMQIRIERPITSVADPNPDPTDPQVFGPQGCGSAFISSGSWSSILVWIPIRIQSGSRAPDPDLQPCWPPGSIIMQNSKKNLGSYYFVTLFDFLSLKKDLNVPSKSNKQKK